MITRRPITTALVDVDAVSVRAADADGDHVRLLNTRTGEPDRTTHRDELVEHLWREWSPE